MDLEKLGIPTVTVVSTAFEYMARAEAKALGMEELRIIVIPHPFADLKDDQVHVVADRITPLATQALSGPAGHLEYRDPILAQS
ncbi:MAG: hypothetical protein HY329_25515 [Chloroflexi bacterium]|nr:hypothetical protein [Chloroflexota bacterium]